MILDLVIEKYPDHFLTMPNLKFWRSHWRIQILLPLLLSINSIICEIIILPHFILDVDLLSVFELIIVVVKRVFAN